MVLSLKKNTGTTLLLPRVFCFEMLVPIDLHILLEPPIRIQQFFHCPIVKSLKKLGPGLLLLETNLSKMVEDQSTTA
jgi:hypothetical protein